MSITASITTDKDGYVTPEHGITIQCHERIYLPFMNSGAATIGRINAVLTDVGLTCTHPVAKADRTQDPDNENRYTYPIELQPTFDTFYKLLDARKELDQASDLYNDIEQSFIDLAAAHLAGDHQQVLEILADVSETQGHVLSAVFQKISSDAQKKRFRKMASAVTGTGSVESVTRVSPSQKLLNAMMGENA